MITVYPFEQILYKQAEKLSMAAKCPVDVRVNMLNPQGEWIAVYLFDHNFVTLRAKIRFIDNDLANADCLENYIIEFRHFRVEPRNCGLGTQFILLLLEEIKAYPFKGIVLEPKNERAAHFWQKVGFEFQDEQCLNNKMYMNFSTK